MRVIAGSSGGVPLRTLNVEGLRPMLDRVKESVFNILRGYLEDARVLDLFAGCGSLGIEALSRGASSCVFVEKNRRLADLIAENLQKCRLSDRTEIMQGDVLHLASRRPPRELTPASLCLCDPPYAMMDDEEGRKRLFSVLEAISGTWLEPHCLLMLHHPPPGPKEWPTDLFDARDSRTYGRSAITFFRASPDATDDKGSRDV